MKIVVPGHVNLTEGVYSPTNHRFEENPLSVKQRLSKQQEVSIPRFRSLNSGSDKNRILRKLSFRE